MQREIKFRAIDKMNVWWYFTLQDLLDIEVESCRTGVLEHWTQYTGLKDKNGVEIYEGDIGRINIIDIGWIICICEWNTEFSGFGWIKINKLQAIFANPANSWSLCVKDFEVIGNIYENKDLLKDY